MRTFVTPQRANSRLRQKYSERFVGDGVTVQFFIAHTVGRLDDLDVYVAGAKKRVADQAAVHDYKVRGLTPGYDGDRNGIKFTAAPAGGADILVEINST